MMRRTPTHAMEHGLVAHALQAADQAKARRILLVSAYKGDGKSHLADCISRHASSVTDQPVDIVKLDTLKKVGWLPDVDHGYVWVDGLAILEGEGPSVLTPAVRGSLDGAILVAVGMETTREEVAECAERLRVLGLGLLGGVWNERDHPPAPEVLSVLKARLRTKRSRLFPGLLRRESRRSA